MKLGELKSKIRTTKGSPLLRVELVKGGATVDVALMKGPLMDALDAAFPGGKSVETGMLFEASGDNFRIRPVAGGIYGIIEAAAAEEPGPLLAIMETPAPAALLIDLDDEPAPAPVLLLDEPAAPAATATSLLLDL